MRCETQRAGWWWSAVLLLVGIGGFSQAEHTVFRKYNVEDGLSQSQVRAIVQDHEGYVWIGTEYGLSRFDGKGFRTYTALDGLLANRISAAYLDSRGRVWLGHVSGGLSLYDDGNWEVFPAPKDQPPAEVQAIIEDRRGVLWVATDGAGLMRLDPRRGLVPVSEEILDAKALRTLSVNRGRLWVGTSDGLYSRVLDGTGPSAGDGVVFTRQPLGHVAVVATSGDSAGAFWIATSEGQLYGCKADDSACESWTGPLGVEQGLPQSIISTLTSVSRGGVQELWLGTMDKGVISTQPDIDRGRIRKVLVYSQEEGLGLNTVTAVMKDRESNLWFGTDGQGVSVYHGSPFTPYMQSKNPLKSSIWCMIRDKSGRMWFGTQGGLIVLGGDSGQERHEYTVADGLPSDSVRDILEDDAGYLWLAFDSGGLGRFDPWDESLILLTEADGLPGGRLLALAPGDDGSIWVSMMDTGVARWNPPEGIFSEKNKGRFDSWHLKPAGEPDTSVYDVFRDSKGGIWLATEELGLGEYVRPSGSDPQGHFLFHQLADGTRHVSLNNIDEDSRGRLWIVTDDGGVFSYSKQRFRNVVGDSRLSRELVYLVATTPDDRVLVGTNAGLYKYDADRQVFTHFGPLEGFSGVETNVHATFKDSDGSVWFGSIAGAFRYDAAKDLKNTVPPMVHITGLQVHFESREIGPELSFSHSENRLTFNFIGISTTAPDRVSYQYMLEGWDDDWLAPSLLGEANYSNLPHGHYTFLVRASNGDGATSPVPARLSFDIRAPFWRTWWFYALVVLCVGLLLYGALKWQVRRIETSNRDLEASVRERTRALEQSSGELESANQALQRALVAANQAADAKSAFLATMSHEIRTPLNGILGMAELLKSTELNKDQGEFARVIYASGAALLSIINDVLDLSKIEAGRIEIEEIPFDCVELVTGVLAMLAPRASAKGLSLGSYFGPQVPHTLTGDPHRLRQILTNLLGNAIKFTETGQVTLRVEIFATVEPDTIGLRFEVQDSGIGVSAESQQGIFEPFRQEDSSFARRYGGTGLGLAICKRLVEKMGGEIGVVSNPDSGSQFWFFAIVRGEMQTLIDLPLSGRRILVVDPNDAIRTLLREQLEQYGAQVVDLPSAQAAEDCHQDCDWVLLDTGGEQSRISEDVAILRRQENLRRSRILVMLPLEVDGHAVLGPKATLSSLHKPLHPRRLLDALLSAEEDTGPQDQPAASTASGPKPWEQARTLVVDDNKVNLKVAERMLLRLGCEVECAMDGSGAVERVSNSSYDIIFMDCQMPGMDGFEATARIRELQVGEHTPIVALTANAMEGDREKCLLAGMDDYLAKPVNQEQMREILARWLVPQDVPAEH